MGPTTKGHGQHEPRFLDGLEPKTPAQDKTVLSAGGAANYAFHRRATGLLMSLQAATPDYLPLVYGPLYVLVS